MARPDLDLTDYFARIGWRGPVAPDLATLRGIAAHHAAAIPFENLDIVLRRPIELDMPTLRRKLIDDRRGGYCFEQNTLLKAALDAIGFQVTLMLGRVVLGTSAGAGTPRSHIALRVTLPEGDFLADVGFGRLTPTAPLAFGTESPQDTPIETFRLLPFGAETLLEVRIGEDWAPCYRLQPEPPFPVDIDMGNWFTSTRPGGLFTTHLVVSRPVSGQRATLFNGRLTFRRADGALDRRQELRGMEDYRAALRDIFGLTFTEAELRTIAETGDRLAEGGAMHPAFSGLV